MSELLEYYYGKAAPMIREYIETVCAKYEQNDIHAILKNRFLNRSFSSGRTAD